MESRCSRIAESHYEDEVLAPKNELKLEISQYPIAATRQIIAEFRC